MRMQRAGRLALAFLLPWLAGCAGQESGSDRQLFKLLSPNQTGVTFANTITTAIW